MATMQIDCSIAKEVVPLCEPHLRAKKLCLASFAECTNPMAIDSYFLLLRDNLFV
jgi:hypothetical protein